MIDDSIASLVAIGLTALFLSLLNSFVFVAQRLPPGSVPLQGEILKPGVLPGPITVPQIPGLATPQAPLSGWVSSLGREHPLIGRVWSVGRQDGIIPAELVRSLAGADVVLVGEVHDNPDHHRLQAWLIRELVRKGRRPAVVMEMIGRDKADGLAAYLASEGASADGLAAQLRWADSGWPSWELYKPVAEAALSAGLAILSGDASPDQVAEIGRGGLRQLAELDRTTLGLGTPLPATLAAALTSEVRAAHCGTLAEESLGPMTQVQRFRDAMLADSILKATARGNGGVVLIAGAGHVRSDRAVPYYLHLRAPQLKVVSIVLSEVEAGLESPEAALPRDPDGNPAADYVWFTARTERADPCGSLLGKTTSGDIQ